MDEWLFIKVDKLHHWREVKPDKMKCAKDFKARPGERKSAWAHVQENYRHHPNRFLVPVGTVAGLLPLSAERKSWLLGLFPITPSRKLQALCMLLHEAKSRDDARPTTVHYLSIRRAALEGVEVATEPAEHIVPAFDGTHRELDFGENDESKRQELCKLLHERRHRALHLLDYTLDELRPLMVFLCERGLLRSPFAQVAQRILAETSA